MDKFDYKRMYPPLFNPKEIPSIVAVPPFPYFIIDGEGDPADQAYEEAVALLYSMSYTLKMSYKQERWYQDFVVAPLEGVWTAVEVENRDSWRWSSMIAQPLWVTNQIFELVREQVAFKKACSTNEIRFSLVEDGRCLTMLHRGPYREEDRSFAIMDAYCQEHHLQRVGEDHREIYLSDPKKTKPENLKTILRFPIA